MPVIIFIGLIGLVVLGSRRTKYSAGQDYQRGVPVAAVKGLSQTRVTSGGGPPMTPGNWTDSVRRYERNHIRPPEWMVNEAVRECFELGDIANVVGLCSRYGAPKGMFDPAAAATATQQAANLQEGVATITTSGGSTTVSGRSSPLDGVENSEWEEYVRKLATETAEHRTDRHVGLYHHSLERIRQLGLEPPADAESQYQALAADTADSFTRCTDLFRDWLAQVIELDGQPVPVTRSGLLGLIKAAGPDGARSWLANPTDRTSFPRTTATFNSTNGVF